MCCFFQPIWDKQTFFFLNSFKPPIRFRYNTGSNKVNDHRPVGEKDVCLPDPVQALNFGETPKAASVPLFFQEAHRGCAENWHFAVDSFLKPWEYP